MLALLLLLRLWWLLLLATALLLSDLLHLPDGLIEEVHGKEEDEEEGYKAEIKMRSR